MAAPHSTDLSVAKSPDRYLVPAELVGTGLFILVEYIVQKRRDGRGFRVRSRDICTVALPLTLLGGYIPHISIFGQSQGGAQ